MPEEYEYEGHANLFKGIEGVGGKLFLTKHALIHRPHRINFQSKETVIDLKDIANVTTRNTYLIAPNGLLVTTISGKEYKLVVNKREEWVEKINLVRRQS
ncbi:hypothetical protein [Alteribacter aurantiacus]|uniref:hypothetical protein n=1 Tax=Alteribacter aurantiacus TaxID=254410 RepID=UPI000411432F|nr:hypothetical protein [Alteribacter aurantiacus]